ncbi:uncharacterized protein zgc:193726 [Platichthys flesus]|uniref:uncharacterized protein zgc:193726 n=1 Tax=Platichthys flesus TaxID=8260 RepID=UPI002DBD27AF|nr:uncharacterized protein zgc:193726 [Platichthys flesus]
MKSVAVVVVMMMMMMMSSAATVPSSFNNTSQEPNNPNVTSTSNVGYGASRSFTRCSLSTCHTANLMSSLQTGDETAGGAASDPYGIGKK